LELQRTLEKASEEHSPLKVVDEEQHLYPTFVTELAPAASVPYLFALARQVVKSPLTDFCFLINAYTPKQ
jgi:hypothetical protein